MGGTLNATVAIAASGLFPNPLTDSASVVFPIAGADQAGPVSQVIGTSDEQIVFPSDIANVRKLLIVNLDPTNYVQISYTSGGGFSSFSRLDPAPAAGLDGGVYFGRPESLTIYAKANTGACRIKWSLVPL